MASRPIYMGANSVYALKEGMYVRRYAKPGIDTIKEACGILYLILRDYRRGYTYDHDGRIIPMDEVLFERRVRYVYTLAKKHGAPGPVLRRIEDLVEYVLRAKRLPREYYQYAREAIVKRRTGKVKVKVRAVTPRRRRTKRR